VEVSKSRCIISSGGTVIIEQGFLVLPNFGARHGVGFGVGRVLLLILFLSSRAFADVGAAAADSLPSSTLSQGTHL